MKSSDRINLGQMVRKIRSKNAGPFWLTLDIFCVDVENFNYIHNQLQTNKVANLFQIHESKIKRFDIPDLNVIQISFPRPHIQGKANDADMHGASVRRAYRGVRNELKLEQKNFNKNFNK